MTTIKGKSRDKLFIDKKGDDLCYYNKYYVVGRPVYLYNIMGYSFLTCFFTNYL